MTLSLTEIPLSAQSQTLQISLSGVSYRLTVTWRDPIGWFLDVADVNDTKIVSGIPLVAGANLLAPYAHLGIGGGLVVVTDGDVTADPTYDNLGTSCHLYYVVSDG